VKILFSGDSITDAKRDREDLYSLGDGYAKHAADLIKKAFPDTIFEFINTGISGDKAENVRARLDTDCIIHNPDIFSIMVGINDTWHFAEKEEWMPNEHFERCYRDILSRVKKETHAKIIMLEQFLLPAPDKDFLRVDLNPKIDITRTLAREFADVFIPLDGIFAAACVEKEPAYWADDGIHPTGAGAKLMAEHYVNAFKKTV
jgi:lysophospholipase L1-like esterase